MNKKLLILGAIATGLLLTACVKKESPSESDQEQTQVASEPTEFHSLEATTPEQVAPPQEEVQITETQVSPVDTQSSDSRQVNPEPATAPTSQTVVTPASTPKATPAPVVTSEEKPAPASNHTQSEDDAVAAAIAAATPALKN